MHLLVLVCHAILLVQVLSERLVVRDSLLTIEKQAVVMLNELSFAVYGACSFALLNSCRVRSRIAATDSICSARAVR